MPDLARRRARWLLRAVAATAVAIATAALPGLDGRTGPAVARADDAWLAEFEALCGKTQDAMALPVDELRALVRRCDELKPRIDGLDDSLRKVYGRRLKACRDLYAFMLESRTGG